MSTKAAKRENMFTRCVKAPFRILSRAGDFYVRALTGCSGRMNYASATGPINMMPRSSSVNSSRSNVDEDLRELVRAASQRGLIEKLEMKIRKQQQYSEKLPRSFTVGMGRIDEDKPCDFEDDAKVKLDLMYPRSKSHAVTKRTSYTF